MSHKNEYRPDYSDLYPGLEISDELLAFLKKSDRQMEYLERELKRDRYLRDKSGRRVTDANGQPLVLPEREISLDKLLDEDWDFASNALIPEDALIAKSEMTELYRCLALLDADEKALIEALFYEGLTEREYADILGITQPSVHGRKQKIIAKLKKFWKF